MGEDLVSLVGGDVLAEKLLIPVDVVIPRWDAGSVGSDIWSLDKEYREIFGFEQRHK